MSEWQSQISWFAIHVHSIACYLKVIDHLGTGRWSQWVCNERWWPCLCWRAGMDGWAAALTMIVKKKRRAIEMSSAFCVEVNGTNRPGFRGPHTCINIRNRPIWLEVSRSGCCQWIFLRRWLMSLRYLTQSAPCWTRPVRLPCHLGALVSHERSCKVLKVESSV